MYPYAKDVYRLMSMSLHLLGSGGTDTEWPRGGHAHGGSRDDRLASGETSEPRGNGSRLRNGWRYLGATKH